jgi:hypothetical protein
MNTDSDMDVDNYCIDRLGLISRKFVITWTLLALSEINKVLYVFWWFVGSFHTRSLKCTKVVVLLNQN